MVWYALAELIIKFNEINILIIKELRCIHYKKYNESVRNFKVIKNISNIENLFKSELEIFMFNFINKFLPVNFKCYF